MGRTPNTSRARRTLRFATTAKLFAEVEALAVAEREGRLTGTGNWSLGQAVNHVAVWAEYAFTGVPLPAPPPWIVRFVMRRLKGRILKRGMPAGMRLRGVPNGTLGVEPTPTPEAIARLHAAIARLEREAPAKPNALLGPLTQDQWLHLQLRHAELHLSFFHAEPSDAQRQ